MATAQMPGRDRLPPPDVRIEARAADKLTQDDLGKMLKDMGYTFKAVKQNNGVIVHQLDIPYKDRVVPLDISLSSSGSKLWMSVWFTPLAAGQTYPNHVLMQMLETNQRWGPCHFAMDSKHQMALSCPVDNRSLTQDELRRWIDFYLNVYDQTENLWNSGKWTTQVGGGR